MRRGTLPIVGAVTLLGALATGGCPSRRATDVATASGSASGASGASASDASSAAAAAGGAALAAGSTKTSGAPSAAPAAPFASVSWRALVAAEAWGPAADALAALSAADRDRVEVELARARVGVGRCTREGGTAALDAISALRARTPAPAKGVLALVDRLEVDALVCAERWTDALAFGGPAGLASRDDALSARTLARVREAAGDSAGARVALGKAIAGAPKAGLSLGALLVWRLRLARAAGDATAIAADRRRMFLELPAAFDAAVAAGEPADPPTLSAEDWLARARALATGGDATRSLDAIDAAAKLGLSPRAAARARGAMLYRAKAYARAATALTEAATLAKDDDALDDAFHAARALSRAGDDAHAIERYDALAKAHPGARWGAEAALLAGNLRFQHGQWSDAIAAFDRYLAASSKAPGQEGNAREARKSRAFAMLLDGRPGAGAALDALLAGKDFDKDSFAAARVVLLRAVAAQRAGNAADAIARLQAVRSAHPYGWLELVARTRLATLGVVVTPWPAGPIESTPLPALAAPIDVLRDAGLGRDARRLLGKIVGDDPTTCATFAALDAGWDAYALGQHLDVSRPPDTTAWAWRCAYPTPYDEVVAALEAREGLPRGLMHAVLRQESGFRVDVVSPAGAVGIAQIMPQTAASTAKGAGLVVDEDDVAALQAPFLQLDLSSRHLHALLDEFGGAADPRAAPLTIAAYNAGSAAVKRWLTEAGTLDADLFVERIPFLETRGYTARVVGNLVRYAILAGATPPTLPATFAASTAK